MSRRHLLTGGGSGIGAAVARRLHARGDDLVLLARSEERGASLRRDFPGAAVMVADLARPATLEELALPASLDSLLHIAGVVDLNPVADAATPEWRHQIDVNLIAPAVLTRLALPALRGARGTVVFVNSGAGLFAHPTWSAYAASKFGLRALADALRAEEAPHGVRVTSIFPGRTASPMQQKVHDQEGRPYDAAEWTSPDTVAELILHVLDLPDDATVPDVTLRPGPGR